MYQKNYLADKQLVQFGLFKKWWLQDNLKMLAVRNWLMPERKAPANTKMGMPEQLLRSFRRRSLRVKRTKSLVIPEKRKSGEKLNYILPAEPYIYEL